MERIRIDKMEADTHNQQGLLNTISKRVDSDSLLRQRSEDDIKKYVEIKFTSIVEQLKQDEKSALGREHRLLQQVQEGLVTMNDIIKGTKEQNLISVTHQQTLLTEQNKKLKEMVDSIQTNIYGRQQGIETELNDQRAKVQEIETVVVKQVTNANKTVENELNRFEKIMSAFEKYLESQLGDVRQSLQQ